VEKIVVACGVNFCFFMPRSTRCDVVKDMFGGSYIVSPSSGTQIKLFSVPKLM
jgi:hypothetical protein